MSRTVDLSIVIPVFNGGRTVADVVGELGAVFASVPFEIVLVNDGSTDDSEAVCRSIARKDPRRVTFIQLSRNFGEHNAVLAGLKCANGASVGILDDDGQNPPAELMRLWRHLVETGDDVVYGRYAQKQCTWFRRFGSWFNGLVATILIGKPYRLYFSSFKVMTHALVREIIKYEGPYPYLDGLIYRSTSRISQVDVVHCRRKNGRSGYNLRKLAGLWLNMCLGFSIVPLRVAFLAGATTFVLGLLLAVVVVGSTWGNPGGAASGSLLFVGLLLLSGIQLLVLGTLSEYLGRVHLQQSGMPPYVVRSIERGDAADD